MRGHGCSFEDLEYFLLDLLRAFRLGIEAALFAKEFVFELQVCEGLHFCFTLGRGG